MCTIGCYGDQSDCTYMPSCDETTCKCQEGLKRVRGRCVAGRLSLEECESTPVFASTIPAYTTTTGTIPPTPPTTTAFESTALTSEGTTTLEPTTVAQQPEGGMWLQFCFLASPGSNKQGQ